MNTTKDTKTTDDGRAALERRADTVRRSLSRTIGALAEKRRQVFDMADPVKRYITVIAATGAAVVLVAGVTGGIIIRQRRSGVRMWRARFRAVSRALAHPNRIARVRLPVGASALRTLARITGAALTMVVVQFARRSMAGRAMSAASEAALRPQ